MSSPRCPSCERPVKLPPENKTFPFCSERCRTIDLGRWLGEEFRVPTRQVEEDEDGQGLPPGAGSTPQDA
ncbi:MAG: DNA gyrase inhibitor YacG [Myxococcus sp.]|nr:DNA gyrase inhibitor YacG [Myxococcus sp.]